jgi:glycosyltransferase involved in cell wall biosynthesis
MRLAIVTHQGSLAAGAEHALLQFLERLPTEIKPLFFFFEDGEFAQEMRTRFGSVTVIAMSERVATAKRSALPVAAIADGFGLAWRLSNALRAAKPDMVLTNSMKSHIVGSLAARSIGIPCVNYIHDIVVGPGRMLLRLVSRFCAVERLTCSNAVADNLDLPRTTTAYAAIDVATFADLPSRSDARAALGLPDDGIPIVALVGRIARWKGQDRFLRVARKVIDHTDAHFVIVGSPLFGCDANYVSELEAAVSAGNLQQRVHFVPWQANMRNVYAAIDLSCNCSIREPFGRTSLEALAAGLPIVCFDDAGISEIFEQNRGGTRVPAGDEEALAAAVRSYLEDPAFLARSSEAALRAAAPLDIANVYRTFADVLERVGNACAMRSPATDTISVGMSASSVPR